MPVEDVFKIDDINRGQVLAEFGTVHSYTQFESRIYVLIKQKDGHYTSFFNNYLSRSCQNGRHFVYIHSY